MQLKRAVIIEEKLGKCMLCNKTKKILVTREKATKKILPICMDCLKEQGEDGIFYSKKEFEVLKDPWAQLAITIFFAGFLIVIIWTILSGLEIFGLLAIPKEIEKFSGSIFFPLLVIFIISIAIFYWRAGKTKKPKF